MRVLLELRPAFDGHSGIPQETRLLFRGLADLDGIEVVGLIQSSNLLAAPGLPAVEASSAPTGQADIDRLSRVVVSLQQGPVGSRSEHLARRWTMVFGPMLAMLASLIGRPVPLGRFEPAQFKDFLWRALFAKSLAPGDFDLVTSRTFRVLRWPWSLLHAGGVFTARFLRHAFYMRLDTSGMDVMIVETPYPARVSRRTKMVVRYHDAIPLLMPHTIKARSYHRASHYNALARNVRDGAWFACVSESTRQDLLSVFPQLGARAVTIPNMVPHHFFLETESAERVPEVIWTRKNRDAPFGGGAEIPAAELASGHLDYLLMVSTIEPRKNHLALLDAWELLRHGGFPHLNLVFVGSLGWEHEHIVKKLGPWLQRGGLHLLEDVPTGDLRLLYRHAQVTVCPSFGEGFDFPGIEAMRCGGVVAASDIPVHRDVFADACDYFSPYAVDELVQSLRRLIGPDAAARRDALRVAGQEVAARYLPERILPQWRDFLVSLRA